jgi:4-hydroxybenzoate polyprenyltransferase
LFSGGSLLKDVANVEGDRRSGIQTIFTRFDANMVLPIVATFVAAGFMLPAVFLSDLVDLVLFLVMGVGVWVLIMLMRSRSYKPVLLLYFVEGFWLFVRLFLTHSS